MKILSTLLVSLFLMSSSLVYAETNSFQHFPKPGATTLENWTAGDHLGAAQRYEEESRLLQAEARGMEHVEMKILPYLEVEALKEAGIQNLIDRRLKEADENMKMANWHHKEALQLIEVAEAKQLKETSSHMVVPTGMSQVSQPYGQKSYMKYDWIEEEAILGW